MSGLSLLQTPFPSPPPPPAAWRGADRTHSSKPPRGPREQVGTETTEGSRPKGTPRADGLGKSTVRGGGSRRKETLSGISGEPADLRSVGREIPQQLRRSESRHRQELLAKPGQSREAPDAETKGRLALLTPGRGRGGTWRAAETWPRGHGEGTLWATQGRGASGKTPEKRPVGGGHPRVRSRC